MMVLRTAATAVRPVAASAESAAERGPTAIPVSAPAAAPRAAADTGIAVGPLSATDSALAATGLTAVAAVLSTITEINSYREEALIAGGEVNQYRVEIHKKFTLSVACFNFVLIGIALALRFPRGGIGLVIGGSLVLFALFYVTLTAGEALADRSHISPALAMWLPNGIVFVAGVLGLVRVNREFGSTRGGDLGDLAELLTGWLRRGRRA